MTRRGMGWWRLAIVIVVVSAVLASLVLSHAFAHLTGRLLLGVVLVQPVNALSMIFGAARLGYLSRGTVRPWIAAKAQSLSILILYLLPSRASEIVKPLYLSDHTELTFSKALALVFFERLSDLFIMAAAIILAVFSLTEGRLHAMLPYWIGIGLCILVLVTLLVRAPGLFTRLIDLLPWKRPAAILHGFLQDAHTTLNPRSVPGILALGVLVWTSSFLTVFAFLWFTGSHSITPGNALIVFLASTLGLVVGVAPGGLGTFEGAIVLSLGLFGYGVGEALALAIGMRLSSYLLPAMVALFVLSRESIGIRSFLDRISEFRRRSQPSV
jgi:hypothetical protein